MLRLNGWPFESVIEKPGTSPYFGSLAARSEQPISRDSSKRNARYVLERPLTIEPDRSPSERKARAGKRLRRAIPCVRATLCGRAKHEHLHTERAIPTPVRRPCTRSRSCPSTLALD